MTTPAVTFDYGQTLAELDHEFLAERVREQGAELDPAAARAADQQAWRAYGVAKTQGHRFAWQQTILAFLRAGGLHVPGAGPDQALEQRIADWLWQEQPRRNLWRRRIPGMFELASELHARGVPVAIISNSEGHMAELIDELGESSSFDAIVDSGRLGIDKPDQRIFVHAARELGVELGDVVHIGDSWEADVEGARAVGARAIWFSPSDARALPEGAIACRDALEVRAALTAFRVW
ncbi:MAG TPA: HAD family hydrolase [Polyangiaceae bacterium]